MFLVDVLRPGILVELGTHWGNSYCAFCQAVDELRLSTACYAIDTWKGDDQSGRYGPEVLADLRAHHDPLYGNFSMLVESTFDAALEHFADASIDLLHVDGLHTYAAVKHDVEAWWPKLSDRGVLVLHDINARRLDYGVWRLWEELRDVYPHLELHHAHGLGVLAAGAEQAAEFRELLESPPEVVDLLRQLFHLLGHRLRLQLQVEDARRARHELRRSAKVERKALQTAIDRRIAESERELSVLREEIGSLRAQRDSAHAEAEAARAEVAALQRRWPHRVADRAVALRRTLGQRL